MKLVSYDRLNSTEHYTHTTYRLEHQNQQYHRLIREQCNRAYQILNTVTTDDPSRYTRTP